LKKIIDDDQFPVFMFPQTSFKIFIEGLWCTGREH